MADADYDDLGGYSEPRQGQGVNPARLKAWVNLSGGVASLVLVVGLGIWGYRLAVRDVTGVPVVQAMEGPMRIAPVDPGGEIADHQGLAVNDVAEAGVAAPMPETLTLAPRPVDLAPEDTPGLASQPMPDLAEVSASLVGPPALGRAAADLSLAAAPPQESASPFEVAVDAALAEALGLDPEPVSAVAMTPEMTPEPVVDGGMAVSPRPKPRPSRADASSSQVAETVALPAVTEVDPATIALGTRLVQFGAFDNTGEARAEWARLQGRFGDLMAEKAMVLQPAESGGRTFWRLRAHGFEDEVDARRFCSAFVAQEATCIPVPQR